MSRPQPRGATTILIPAPTPVIRADAGIRDQHQHKGLCAAALQIIRSCYEACRNRWAVIAYPHLVNLALVNLARSEREDVAKASPYNRRADCVAKDQEPQARKLTLVVCFVVSRVTFPYSLLPIET